MSSKYANILFVTGILFLALLFFYPLLIPGRCLFTTDDNLSIMTFTKTIMPQGFFGFWNDIGLLGGGGRVPLMWTSLFLWLMPAHLGFNWLHALDLILASIALAMFLRAAGLHWMAVVLGVITAFWVGSNFTLTYAGHLGKFAALMFAAASLYGIRKTFESDRPWLWSIVTGGFVGFMFLEQLDVALFLGLFLGAYALFRTGLLFQKGMRLKGFLLLVPMGVMALIMAGATLMAGYVQNVSSVAAQQEDNPRQKWEFATQWSWPPEETIDFIAPGYMGWRSGEADGPYWGRMGRSAGWEKTGQGFMNFKLENQYLGVIPVVFAFFAVFAAFFMGNLLRRQCRHPKQTAAGSLLMFQTSPQICGLLRRSKPTGYEGWIMPERNDLIREKLPQESMRVNEGLHGANIKAEVIFWFCAAIVALLLSFGKYFPLYELFYQLPIVNNIRNPNKFLQVFQLAVGILTAYGAHFVFNWKVEDNGKATKLKGLPAKDLV